MNLRSLFVCGAVLVLLFSANGVYAGGGRYQRTKDGKTRVWNNYPQPGDAATWSGDRDAKGYATGKGTLTWHTTNRTFKTGSNIPKEKHIAVTRYSGKMVRGKLEGLVINVDADGKTFHGKFVDGRRTKAWRAGRPGTPREEPVQLANQTGIANSPQSGSVSGGLAGPDQPNTAPAQSAENVTRQGEAEKQPMESVQRTTIEAPAPAEGPLAMSAQHASKPAPDPAISKRVDAQLDDSLTSLIGEASLSRMNATTEPAPQAPAPVPPAAEPPLPAGPQLTAAEVIGLANAEAQRQGFDPGDYHRPKAEYTAADETWSVSYDQKAANGMRGRHFSISVKDKTKKTVVDAGR